MTADHRQELIEQMLSLKAVAVLRAENAKTAVAAARAVTEGGIRLIEVTMTVPDAYDVMQSLSDQTSAILGAGTVLTAEQVDRCIEAGARFIVSPACCPEVVKRAQEKNAVVIPGAMTPTEVLAGWNLGADMIKIFPAARLGAAFLSDLRGPLPEIPLVPTGGITDENALEYLDAGAAMLCFGSWLVDRGAMANGDYDRLTERARRIQNLMRDHKEARDG